MTRDASNLDPAPPTPLSAHFALGMALNGAHGSTEEGIRTALALPEEISLEEVNGA